MRKKRASETNTERDTQRREKGGEQGEGAEKDRQVYIHIKVSERDR